MGGRTALPFSTLSSTGELMSTPPCWRYSMWGGYTNRFVFDRKKYHCAACTEKDVCDIRNEEATFEDRVGFTGIVIVVIAWLVLSMMFLWIYPWLNQ
jgi:hypothetical protein